MASPDISAIVVASGAHDPTRALQALCTQTLPAACYEIVVIETSAGAVTCASNTQDARLRVFRQIGAEQAAAMNLATFLSVSPRLVFLPQKHPAQPDFLEQVLRAHETHDKEGDVIFGATAPDPALPQSALTCLMHDPALWAWREPDCPISFKRTLLTQHGLFDAAFGDGWERVELLWRLRARRIRLVCAPEALVHLGVSPSICELEARAERQGRFHARLARKHPGALMDAYAQIGDAIALWAARKPQAAGLSGRVEALDVLRAKGVTLEWTRLGEA